MLCRLEEREGIFFISADYVLCASKINLSVILAFSVIYKHFHDFIYFNSLEVRNGQETFREGF